MKFTTLRHRRGQLLLGRTEVGSHYLRGWITTPNNSATRPGSLDNEVDLCSEDCVHTVCEGSCMSRVVGRGGVS